MSAGIFSTPRPLPSRIGPTLAGILVSTVGLAACFIVDGVSYFAVIVMLPLGTTGVVLLAFGT